MTYTGLCIGGPDDGLIKTANDEIRVGYKINQTEVYGFGVEPPSMNDAILERVFYRFEQWQAAPQRYGFWLVTGMTGADAIERMRAVYAKATNMTIQDIQATMERACGSAKGTGSVLP